MAHEILHEQEIAHAEDTIEVPAERERPRVKAPLIEIPTRWVKILKDMWGNKTRSLLVIFSIAVGVAAIGMIRTGRDVIENDLFAPFLLTNPSSASLYIAPLFDTDLAHAVEGMPEVERVEARRTVAAFAFDPQGKKWDFGMEAVPDFKDIRVNQFDVEKGIGTPGVREVLLERRSADSLGVTVGDVVTVQLPDKNTYPLTVVGIVHDLSKIPPFLFNETNAYVTMDTLRWMGQGDGYNRLDVITSEPSTSRAHVVEVASQVRDRTLEPAGYALGSIAFGGFSSKPRSFWSQDQINGINVVLNAMSIMCMLLSGGLVINTISAILTQQVKQIGVLRSIGGRRAQIIEMYLTNVLVFSVLALIIAIPLGLLGGFGLASFFADRLNFDVRGVSLSPSTLLIQVAAGLLIPLGAALLPVIAGTNISVYDAVYQYGISGSGRNGIIDRQLNRIQTLTRPLAMSIRNTFRNKARLGFTLATLTLAGAMFISVFSTRASLGAQITEMQRYLLFDVTVPIPRNISVYIAEREARRVPGVAVAEGWANTRANVIHADNSEGGEVEIRTTPDKSITIAPEMVAGRWLLPDDGRNVVISYDVLDHEPDLKVGDSLTLSINEKQRTYHIVGIASRHINRYVVYMDYGQFVKATGWADPVSEVRIRVDPAHLGTRPQQEAVAKAVEQHFRDAGISQSHPHILPETLDQISKSFDIVLIFLIIMASLLSIVGGLGLAGTMSMNVMERTREIGVLRAVGASSRAVRRIVLFEGMVVGLTSWLLSVLLSYPLGKGLSDSVGVAVFHSASPYTYSWQGMIGWLVLATLIGAAASLAPARRASRLTVRQVLAYE